MFKIGKTNSLKINNETGEGHVIIKEEMLDCVDPRERLDIFGDWIGDLHYLYERAYCEAYHDEHLDGDCPTDNIETTINTVQIASKNLAQLVSDIKIYGAEFIPFPNEKDGAKNMRFAGRVMAYETIGRALQRTHDDLFLAFLCVSESIESGRWNKNKPVVLSFTNPERNPRPRRSLKHQK